jgi:hypothetical protein
MAQIFWTLFGFHLAVLSVFTFFPRISNFFDPSITEETWVVEICIWCIKIGNVLVLHFNRWVKVSAGGLLVPEGLYSSSVLAIEYEYELNCQEKSKFCKFTSELKILSHGQRSVLRWIWLNFMALSVVFIWRLFQFLHFVFSDFQLFRPEYHWIDLSSRNAHLVHKNW